MSRRSKDFLLPHSIRDQYKHEIANELGITPQIDNGHWDNVSSLSCGKVGGNIGGPMVKVMVKNAEQMLISKYGQQ